MFKGVPGVGLRSAGKTVENHPAMVGDDSKRLFVQCVFQYSTNLQLS